eukprot:3356714-Prorocentrum_lima.AAC.1
MCIRDREKLAKKSALFGEIEHVLSPRVQAARGGATQLLVRCQIKLKQAVALFLAAFDLVHKVSPFDSSP